MTDRQILEAVLAEVKGLVTRMDRMEEHQERFEEETRNNFANLRRHLENVTDRNISLLAESHLSLINQMDRSTVWMNKMLVDEFKLNIFYADYDGTTDKGNTAAAAVFTANPQITTWMVMGANEEGTIGACRALETAGLDANACVVGLGAYMAKDEWNDKGADGTCMKAAAYFSSQSVGEGSVDVLMKLINGEDVDMETAVDAEIVTPDNYKDVMGDAAN